MRRATWMTAAVAAWVVASWRLAALAGADQPPMGESPQELSVERTFDGQPFRYRSELLSRKPAYCVFRLTYPSPVVTALEQNNTVPADYYLPEGIHPGDPRRPAVIVLHILEGNFELEHMTCSVLASRGIPALMFKLPYYGERSLPEGRHQLARDPRLFVDALSQGDQDLRRTIDLLASRPEVDPQRIGATGISLGGIVAATAAGREPRLSRVVLILTGGDLKYIIHHARETRELSEMIRALPAAQREPLERAIEEVDPLTTAAGLRDRALAGKVLMINAADDHVVERPCTEKLAAALGMTDKVIWLNGLGHYTAMAALPQSLRSTGDFFAQDLPAGVQPVAAAAAPQTPLGRVVDLIQQAGAMLVSEPGPGRCHFVDLAGGVSLGDGKKIDVSFRFVRGNGHRFSLQCRLPEVGEATMGQGTYPWLASSKGSVFRGSLAGAGGTRDPLGLAKPDHVVKLKVLSGVLSALAIAPDTLETWVTVEETAAAADGRRTIQVVNKRSAEDRLQLTLDPDGKTPKHLSFEIRGVRGQIDFRAWQLDTVAHDSLFEPPQIATVREVDADDLYRIFAAMFNFAMENVQ